MTSGERLLVVLGPTGTGKSALALALAEALDGEIVGCDAVQVYQGLDCATAKPSAEERRLVPHHVVDCVDPRHDHSLAEYVRAAERAIDGIRLRGRVPLVVGGSGLYLRGLLRGVLPAPPRDPELRSRLYHIVERGGAARLRRWLVRRDPRSAARIAPADLQRMIRALELALSDSSWSDRLAQSGGWSHAAERFLALKIGLDLPRADLAARLEARVDRFFEAGLVEEVRTLLDLGIPRTANAFKAIGYREVLRELEGSGDVASARAAARRSTRQYAKRQRTWFRGEPGVLWLDGRAGVPELLGQVLRLWQEGRPAEPQAPSPVR